MSDLFSIYEDNLNSILNRIKKIIENFPNLSQEKTESAIADANNSIKEADRLIKQMEIECSANSNKGTNSLFIKLKNYTNEFDTIKKTFLKIQENYINKKSQAALLLGSEENRDGDTGGLQKNKLLDNEELALSQHSKLENAKRVLAQTEVVSNDIMKNMDQQTNQMKDIHIKINDVNQGLEDSGDLLHKMEGRISRNRKIIIICAGIFIITAAIILLKNLLTM